MLGVTERTFRRWRDRMRSEGRSGLIDRRIGEQRPRSGLRAHFGCIRACRVALQFAVASSEGKGPQREASQPSIAGLEAGDWQPNRIRTSASGQVPT
jgi:hypothetical protein